MTCSVFKEENEENIQKFIRRHAYEIVFQKYFGGHEYLADTIYGCLLRKKA
jgi:16S rRNA C967 or C1407 C5-methylase (RsmB/RsmF family)